MVLFWSVYCCCCCSILAAKIGIWTFWSCCAPHAIDGFTNRASGSSWANWYHLPQIMLLFVKIAHRPAWKVSENLKRVRWHLRTEMVSFKTSIWNSFVLYICLICAAISQMCVTAIANLQQATQKKGKTKFLFHKDEDIIPFMEQYWEAMTTMPRRVTQSWYEYEMHIQFPSLISDMKISIFKHSSRKVYNRSENAFEGDHCIHMRWQCRAANIRIDNNWSCTNQA